MRCSNHRTTGNRGLGRSLPGLVVLGLLAAGDGGAVTDCETLRPDLERIAALEQGRDLAGLEGFVEARLEAWRESGTDCFGHQILRATQAFESGHFEDERQYEAVGRYARLGLELGAGELPLEVEVKLVLYTELDLSSPELPAGAEWAELRSADLEHWFRVWRILRQRRDDAWDPSDLPLTKVSAPGGLPAGVAPEAIADPALRAQYEAAVAANRRKAERYREQVRLRKLGARFTARAEPYVVAAYSRPPLDLRGLRDYLERYLDDPAARSRISEAVRARSGS